MKYSRRSRNDDALFIALLVIPAVFSAVFYLQSESQTDQLASSGSPRIASAKNLPTRTTATDARLARASATD